MTHFTTYNEELVWANSSKCSLMGNESNLDLMNSLVFTTNLEKNSVYHEPGNL